MRKTRSLLAIRNPTEWAQSFSGSSHQRRPNLIYSCIYRSWRTPSPSAQSLWASRRSRRERRASGPGSPETSETPRPLLPLRSRERVRVHLGPGSDCSRGKGGRLGGGRYCRTDGTVVEEHRIDHGGTRPDNG